MLKAAYQQISSFQIMCTPDPTSQIKLNWSLVSTLVENLETGPGAHSQLTGCLA